MPRLSTFSAASYRAWINQMENHCANSGYQFPLLIPKAIDNYTLSELGVAQTGAYPWSIDTGYIKYLINGQGRGVFGRGIDGNTSSSLYMLLYDPTGAGNYTYGLHDDCFQPGTPHEMGGVFVDGVFALGGGNEPSTNKAGSANGTVRSWQMPDGRIVVLMGNQTNFGHAVFQYYSRPGESIVRMHMSYTNTTTASHTVKMQRGGDPDFGQFPTNNGRGISPVPATNVVYSVDPIQNRTLAIYTPGNGYTVNSSIEDTWPLYNPDRVLLGSAPTAQGDYSIYNAWNIGTVAPGQTVFVTCFYIVGIGLDEFPKYIC